MLWRHCCKPPCQRPPHRIRHGTDVPGKDKLLIFTAALLAEQRRARGLKLNYPEAIALGGDILAATFSPELSDLTMYVIDVAAGEKIPRKGGPGITKSDLFVINKTDLAPYVCADLAVMQRDNERMRSTTQGIKSPSR